MFILLMQFLWKYIDDLVGKGLEWYIIAELLFYASSTFVPLALPLAMLLSSLMTFGNFGEKYELVAMKSSGISFRKIMQSITLFSVFISIAAFYFSNNILPIANLKMRTLLYDVREQKPAVNIKEGVFYYGIDNYNIRVGKKDNDGKTIHKVMIYDHTQHLGNNNITLAEWGKMEFTEDKRFLIFNLYNGVNYSEDISNRKKAERMLLQRIEFKEQVISIDLSEFALSRTNEDFFKDNYRMLNLKQLNIVIDSLTANLNKNKKRYITGLFKDYMPNYNFIDSVNLDSNKDKNLLSLNNTDKDKRNLIYNQALEITRRAKEYILMENEDQKNRARIINKHFIEYHRKYTLSVACLIFFFIGAPLGAIIRRGGFGLPVVISVVFFIVYHVISVIGEKFARESVIPVNLGMWISTILVFPLGVLLTYKATTDAPLLDVEAWNKIFKFFFIKKKKVNNE